MKKWIYGCALAGCCVILLTGCAATSVPVVGNMTPTPTAATEAPTQEPTETPIPIITTTPTAEATPVPVSLTPIAEAEDHLKTIGTKQTGDNVIRVKLVNSTGSPIKGVTLIPMAAGSYDYDEDEDDRRKTPVNLLAENDLYADKEERILYYDTTDDSADDTGAKKYNMQLTFVDDTSYTMTDVPFSDMREGVIYFNDDVAYIVYLSIASAQQTSTKDLEIQAAADRARIAEEEAARREEEARYEEEEEEQYDDWREEEYREEDDYGGNDWNDDYDDEYDEEWLNTYD